MQKFINKKTYTGAVQSIVLDWAGTAVDHGCMGPAAVFVRVFESFGIAVSTADARQFMGLAKKDHIRAMCELPDVAAAWKEKYGRLPDSGDIDALYDKTAPMMVAAIAGNCEPINGVIDIVGQLREMGIKIGSSTGYVKEMMDVLVPLAREKGYQPDAVFCSSDVPDGRPSPWMCFMNAIALQTYPMASMVKVGDTIADIDEGQNAGMWTVGITRTGNELGLTPHQVEKMPPEILASMLKEIETRFEKAGAHYVLEQTADILPVINDINERLEAGERP